MTIDQEAKYAGGQSADDDLEGAEYSVEFVRLPITHDPILVLVGYDRFESITCIRVGLLVLGRKRNELQRCLPACPMTPEYPVNESSKCAIVIMGQKRVKVRRTKS